jgi:EAL domain-containing protein (putative c-di-GMP-specific phosphodiesterase class I)
MLVGLGFASLFVGAIAERFTSHDAAAEAVEIEMTEADLMRELHAVNERLARIETALGARLANESGPRRSRRA